MSFQHVTPGQPFEPSARTHNALVDLLNGQATRKHQRRGAAHAGETRALVKADADYPRFGVVGLSSPLFTPAISLDGFQERVAFQGGAPAAANQFRFGIYQDQQAYGDLGSAIVDGVTPCKVYVTSSAHLSADVKAGDKTQLQSTGFGAAQILWREPITTYPASVQAVVRVGLASSPFVLGKTDGIINKGGSGVVSVFAGAHPNEADTGENITAVNRFVTTGIGKWVAAAYFNGNWHLISLEC